MLISIPQRSRGLHHVMFANQGTLYAKQGDCKLSLREASTQNKLVEVNSLIGEACMENKVIEVDSLIGEACMQT